MNGRDRWWQAYLAAMSRMPSQQTAAGRAEWCAQQAEAALEAFGKRWPEQKPEWQNIKLPILHFDETGFP
jgi:hypothetical protein